MPARGYCTDADVTNALGGITLSAAQTARLPVARASAEALIHAYIAPHPGWLTGAIANEVHAPAERVYPRAWPVASLTSVRTRGSWTATYATGVAGTDYEFTILRNGRGRLYLPSWSSYERVLVNYTPVTTVPDEVREACTALTAGLMQSALYRGADPSMVAGYSVGGDFSIQFRAPGGQQMAIPALVAGLLSEYTSKGLRSVSMLGSVA